MVSFRLMYHMEQNSFYLFNVIGSDIALSVFPDHQRPRILEVSFGESLGGSRNAPSSGSGPRGRSKGSVKPDLVNPGNLLIELGAVLNNA